MNILKTNGTKQIKTVVTEAEKERVPVIEVTRDYAMFKRIVGNRKITLSHVNNLVNELTICDIAYAFPVVVTKDNYLLDGQHRIERDRANNRPVFFIRLWQTVDEIMVAIVNRNQKGWVKDDYVNFYAERGNKQYIFLKEQMEESHLSSTNLAMLWGYTARADRRIKTGFLELFETEEDKMVLIDTLAAYLSLKDLIPSVVFSDRDFVNAVKTMFKTKSADDIRKIILKHGVEVDHQNLTKDYLRFFEELFDKGKHETSPSTRFF